jgi:predicted MFS family arabinose efflux permease
MNTIPTIRERAIVRRRDSANVPQLMHIDTSPSEPRFVRSSLMLGNLVTGLAIIGPTAMLSQLADGLQVTIRDAGLLVTFGAVMLCFGSPLTAWATSRIERRSLLTGVLLVIALGHAASALAPNYGALLAIRLVMLAAAAVFTPQAASTVALIVPVRERAAAIAYVFLGWSLAIAVGLPLVTFAAAHIGWRETYATIGAIAALTAWLHWARLPAGLTGAPISLASWRALAGNRLILLLLLVTALQTSGQFAVITYLGPLLARLAGAGPQQIATFFAIFGAFGFIGNIIATRIVGSIGALQTSTLFLVSMLIGALLWTFGAPWLLAMGAGILLWGLGFAAVNSMQQGRLVAAAPELSSVSVALNTSALYVGQAIGSGLGGTLFAQDLAPVTGYVAIGFFVVALALVGLTRSRS